MLDNEVFEDYYKNKLPVSKIVDKHSLSVTQAIYKKFPTYTHDELECEYCKIPMISEFGRREERAIDISPALNLKDKELVEVSDFSESFGYRQVAYDHRHILSSEGYILTFPFCSDCKHVPTTKCSCKSCFILREENKTKLVEQYRDVFCDSDFDELPLEEMSVRFLFSIQIILSEPSYGEDNSFRLGDGDSKSKERLLRSGLVSLDKESINDVVRMRSLNEYSISEKYLTYNINHKKIGGDNPVSEIKKLSQVKLTNKDNHIEILDLWSEIALDEAVTFLHHYCDVFGITCTPGDKTLSIIKKSLSKYGLAQTARYIYNSTKNAHTKGAERGLDRKRTFNLIYGSLCFWVDDDRPRDWYAPPFNRSTEVLLESKKAIVFSHSFLDIYSIDYFSAPINIGSLKV